MRFVCPQCKGELAQQPESYLCAACRKEYPVLCGIPDFRLHPDPYIGIEADRRKGQHLLAESMGRTFAELLRYYYSITPEVPADHAERWVTHALAQVEISRETLQRCGIAAGSGALLDVGCATGGLLAAVEGHGMLAGVDVAFRWLVVGQRRLAELGVKASLVCANAESLPFPDGLFHTVTAIDVVEHVSDPQSAIRESRRVLIPGGRVLCATNNRFAPLPDPQVGTWAVGYVPRRWQPAYVAWARQGLHVYRVRMPSATELNRLFRRAGYNGVRTDPAPLVAPHLQGSIPKTLLAAYNRVRTMALAKPPLRLVGPRLVTMGKR